MINPSRFACQLAALGAFLSLAAFRAHATPYLFTSAGAGTVGVTVGNTLGATSVPMTLSVNNTIVNMPVDTDMAIAFAAGDKLTMSSGTIAGQVDFADVANVPAGNHCAAMPGGTCMVNAGSAITNGTISNLTIQNATPINAALNEWLALTSTSTGWGSITGTTANLASGGTLCAGASLPGGCTGTTASSTNTVVVNGVSQTAYVFDITSSGTSINGPVTIKGNGTALVILNYRGTNKLQSNQVFSLSGVSSDQVLLNVTSTGGMQTSGGFNFSGALAITGGGTINLDAAGIAGRLFLNGSSTGSIQSNFALNAPANILSTGGQTPEPATVFLIGGALIAVAIGSKFKRQDKSLPRAPVNTSIK